MKTVVHLDESVYPAYSPPDVNHLATSMTYQRETDTFTVGDNPGGLILGLSRQGEPLWQFGTASCDRAVAPRCWAGFLGRSSGHQLLPENRLLAFYNISLESFSESIVYESVLDETDTLLVSWVEWDYSVTDLLSLAYGDVQRLPNGNTLIVYSSANDIREVTPEGEVVQIVTGSSFGYADFRETLYGPPLR